MSHRNGGQGWQPFRGRGQSRGRSQSRGQSRGRGQSENAHQDQGHTSTSQDDTAKEDAIISNLDDSIQDVVPRRPAYGKQGQDVFLKANYFELDVAKNSNLHFHHISFLDKAREPTGIKLARVVKLLIGDQLRRPFDVVTDFAKTIISYEKLPEGSFTVPYYDEDSTQAGEHNTVNYIVKIEHEETLSTEDLVEYLRDPRRPVAKESLARIVQALNIFINYYPQDSEGYATIGSSRSFPLTQEDVTSLQLGCVARKGFYSSIQPATSRILININVTHGIFHKREGLSEIISGFIAKSGKSLACLRKLAASLKGIRIEYSYLKDKAGKSIRRAKTIFDLASQKDGAADTDVTGSQKRPEVSRYGARADEVKFWYESDYITVSEFFKKVHGVDVEKDLPLINVGSRIHPTYLPSELCQVLPDQRAKLPRYDRDMISDIPIHKPWDNARYIENHGLDTIGFSSKGEYNKARLNKFGLSVSNTCLNTVRGRKMPVPQIMYWFGSAISQPTWNLRGIKLGPKVGADKTWMCVAINPKAGDLKRLDDTVNDLASKLNGNGVFVQSNGVQVVAIASNGIENLRSQLARGLKDRAQRLDFVLVVLPTKYQAAYNCVKRLGDLDYGVPTICILRDTLFPERPPPPPPPMDQPSGYGSTDQPQKPPPNPLGNLVGNLALKLNLKFYNNNQAVHLGTLGSTLNMKETMIVGIDVTHSPNPNQPSIAGMVASVDEHLGQWPAVLRHQDSPRIEMVTHLQEMLETRLELWREARRNQEQKQHRQKKQKQQHPQCRLPKNIIVYRDGVSEGQYKLVLEKELPKLKDACKKLYEKDMPKITVVIVGKRHHTRFYAKEDSSNPAPGTVVDRGITQAVRWDFFLQAHRAIVGTARPTHYFVVHDEIFREKFQGSSADALETLTHCLCYVFGRSTGAVGVCTPAYYADLVCNRARCYVAADATFSRAPPPPPITGSAVKPQSPPLGSQGIRLHRNMENSMFYI
ncbi:Piwi-domain-containing protein [Daldinia caldariorum]|uniref:Piwi-domain-containing protein n=1 Tax=Daldinia caldariorum TaxID=326644 RepID=UPI002007AE95|nr:Piwi-domain-containing protein [Daldinia caldariorum]KAI1467708.1 Piwi-domain-containing protein [Daldinia caldariorum]